VIVVSVAITRYVPKSGSVPPVFIGARFENGVGSPGRSLKFSAREVPHVAPEEPLMKSVASTQLSVRAFAIGIDARLIVSVRGAVPVPPLLLALSETVEVPMPVGVPEIKPLVVFTVRPEGNPVALKLVGEFEAVI